MDSFRFLCPRLIIALYRQHHEIRLISLLAASTTSFPLLFNFSAVGSVLRNWPHVFSILNLFPTPVPPPTTFDSPEDPLNPSSTSSSNGNGNGNLNLAGNRGADDEALAEREKSLPQLVRLQFGDGE